MEDPSVRELQQTVASYFRTNWGQVSRRAKVQFNLESKDGLLQFLASAERASNRYQGRSAARAVRREFAIAHGFEKWSEINLKELTSLLQKLPDSDPAKGWVLLRVVEKLQHIENRGRRRVREEREAEAQSRREVQRLRDLSEQDQFDAEARDEHLAECQRYKHPEIRTKKEARRLGFFSAKELNSYHRGTGRRPMVPKIGERPIGIKDELFWHPDQCERLMSATEGSRRGLRLIPFTEPEDYRHAHFGKAITYAVYRESDFVSVRDIDG